MTGNSRSTHLLINALSSSICQRPISARPIRIAAVHLSIKSSLNFVLKPAPRRDLIYV